MHPNVRFLHLRTSARGQTHCVDTQILKPVGHVYLDLLFLFMDGRWRPAQSPEVGKKAIEAQRAHEKRWIDEKQPRACVNYKQFLMIELLNTR